MYVDENTQNKNSKIYRKGLTLNDFKRDSTNGRAFGDKYWN